MVPTCFDDFVHENTTTQFRYGGSALDEFPKYPHSVLTNNDFRYVPAIFASNLQPVVLEESILRSSNRIWSI